MTNLEMYGRAVSGGCVPNILSPIRYYGVHRGDCNRDNVHHNKCDCGFVQAIAGEPHNNEPRDCRGGNKTYNNEFKFINK